MIIDDLALIRPIGRGALGDVYLHKRKILKIDLQLKKLPEDF